MVSTTCDSPARTPGAHAAQLGQVEFEPDDEHQEHDAELGQVLDAGVVLGQRQRVGADEHAHHQVAQHRRQLQRAAGHHAQHRGHQVQQDDFERGGHGPASGQPPRMPDPISPPQACRLDPTPAFDPSAPCSWPRAPSRSRPGAAGAGRAPGRRLRRSRAGHAGVPRPRGRDGHGQERPRRAARSPPRWRPPARRRSSCTRPRPAMATWAW
jgi:hypothetical protein